MRCVKLMIPAIVVFMLLAVSTEQGRAKEMDVKRIHWLGHASFRIEFDGKQIYIDPYKLRGNLPKADYIFITHAHFDHFSKEDLAKIESPSTHFVVTKDVAKEIKGNITTVAPGDTVTVGDLKVVAVPAYNIGKRFHPKENGWVGYVIQLPDGMRVYHAGDTDFIPEMKQVQTDVALLPIGGTYTMDYQQAAEAARAIRPKVVIPMHWGDIVGTREDAEKFREAYQGEVLILTPER